MTRNYKEYLEKVAARETEKQEKLIAAGGTRSKDLLHGEHIKFSDTAMYCEGHGFSGSDDEKRAMYRITIGDAKTFAEAMKHQAELSAKKYTREELIEAATAAWRIGFKAVDWAKGKANRTYFKRNGEDAGYYDNKKKMYVAAIYNDIRELIA